MEALRTSKPKAKNESNGHAAGCLRLARRLKTVSGTPQLIVLMQLGDSEQSVGDLHASLGGTMSAASRHLSLLRLAGIVVSRRDGHWVLYSLTDDGRGLLRVVEALVLNGARSR